MPYKDPTQKTEWEQRHRQQRLARRRELRRIEAARGTAKLNEIDWGGSAWPLVVFGGAVAVSNPWLGLGAGSLTFTLAAFRKANWKWWIIGAITVLISLCVLWSERKPSQKTHDARDRDNEG